ncbi:MAG: GMC oxidoreductase [Alcanivoracaceae bacterium]
MRTERIETVVIGSGFGGAVAAARLVDSGVPVTLLERGPWRDTAPLANADLPSTAPLPSGRHFPTHVLRRASIAGRTVNLHRDGLFDIHLQRELSLVCSSGVGGGSHVYSAMNVRPAVAGFWGGHHEAVDDAVMEPHYRWILSQMGSRPVADMDTRVPNWIGSDNVPGWMTLDGVEQPALGLDPARGQFARNSFFGSRDGNKVTLDERLLLPRLGKGLQVRDRHEVLDIARTNEGLRLTVHDHGSGHRRVLLAGRVLLAAGTLNSLKLLFASRARGSLCGMPALGLGIGGNGDVPAWWACREPRRDYRAGPPSHGRFTLVDFDDCPDLTRYGFNGLPAPLSWMLRRDLVLVGMGADEANGLARWHRGRLLFAYNGAANPVLARIHRAFDEISRRSGRPVRFLRHNPLTVHPLGGARMGQDLRTSVVNADGEVHGVPGLYVCDASALPAAPGSPPSMSIAAWAGHVATTLTQATTNLNANLEGGHAA